MSVKNHKHDERTQHPDESVKRCFQQPKTTNTRCTSLFSPGSAPSSRKGQVLSPIHFRRSIEQQPAVHILNGWFVTDACIFQRAEGCAVLLLNAIGRGKKRVPAVSLSLSFFGGIFVLSGFSFSFPGGIFLVILRPVSTLPPQGEARCPFRARESGFVRSASWYAFETARGVAREVFHSSAFDPSAFAFC